jgi:hypothetical protein
VLQPCDHQPSPARRAERSLSILRVCYRSAGTEIKEEVVPPSIDQSNNQDGACRLGGALVPSSHLRPCMDDPHPEEHTEPSALRLL